MKVTVKIKDLTFIVNVSPEINNPILQATRKAVHQYHNHSVKDFSNTKHFEL